MPNDIIVVVEAKGEEKEPLKEIRSDLQQLGARANEISIRVNPGLLGGYRLECKTKASAEQVSEFRSAIVRWRVNYGAGGVEITGNVQELLPEEVGKVLALGTAAALDRQTEARLRFGM